VSKLFTAGIELVASPRARTATVLFFSLTFCYLAMAPGTVDSRGYVPEEMNSGIRMLEMLGAWLNGSDIPPMIWSKHGPIPVLLDLPFVLLGRFFIHPDFVLSLQPELLTAALITLLFLWSRKLASPGVSMLLALISAFGTMLWPYAYIGLEVKQSLLVLLAGYLALAGGRIQGWPKLIFFALVGGLALIVKATGVLMLPAIAYLLFVQCRDNWRSRLPQLLAVVLVMAALVGAGTLGWRVFWTPMGGAMNNLRPWMIDVPLQFFSNAIGVFGSPNKGLLMFAPILLASLFCLPRAFREHRDLTVFAVLVAAGQAAFLSLLKVSADETWGSRYMHVAIAPLVLCISAAWPRFEWRRHAASVVLGMVGVAVSFLGAFYYYGAIHAARAKAGHATMEWVNGDPVWNEVAFDARLLRAWMTDGDDPILWTPSHVWVWSAPSDFRSWIAVDLRDYATPQSFLVRFWNTPTSGKALAIFCILFFCLVAGPPLLIWTIMRSVRESATEAAEFTEIESIPLL